MDRDYQNNFVKDDTANKKNSILGMKSIPNEPETWFWEDKEYTVTPDMTIYRVKDGHAYKIPTSFTFSYNETDFGMILNHLTVPIYNYLLPTAISGTYNEDTKVCSDVTIFDPVAFTRLPQEVTIELTPEQYATARRYGIKAVNTDPTKGCKLTTELNTWGVYNKAKLVCIVSDTSEYGVELALADVPHIKYDHITILDVCKPYIVNL